MCAHSLIDTTMGNPIRQEDYVRQFAEAYKQHNGSRFPVICVYNEGNMLNDLELPFEALADIIRIIKEGGARRLIIESRTEYISREKMAQLISACDGLELEIGIGLESVNEFVRRAILQKEMTLPAFERAVHVLKEYGARALAYVVLKPPFLSEAEAIRDTVDTATYAFTIGVDAISIEPIGVEPFTIIDRLHSAGLFRPAWLWSLITVANELFHLGEVRLGGLQFAPIPETLSKNCDTCDPVVIAAIRHYNLCYDPSPLLTLNHDCRVSWERETSGWRSTKLTDQVLRERAVTAYKSLLNNTISGIDAGLRVHSNRAWIDSVKEYGHVLG